MYVLYIYKLNLFYIIIYIHLYIPLYTQLYLHIPVHTLFTHDVLYICINILFMHTTYTKVCSHHCAINLYMQPILYIPSVCRQPQLVCAQTVNMDVSPPLSRTFVSAHENMCMFYLCKNVVHENISCKHFCQNVAHKKSAVNTCLLFTPSAFRLLPVF